MHTIHKKEFELADFSHEHLIDMNGYGDMEFFKKCLLNVTEKLNMARKRYLQTNDKNYWWQMIQLLPSSYNQKRTVTMNYEVVVNIIHQRENHKLDEWNVFCDTMLEKLPYLKEIMEYDKTN